MVVLSTVEHVSPKSPIDVQLCCDLVTVKATAHDSHHFHTHQTFSDASVLVIMEETTPFRIEMFHHRIKVITQNNFVLICSDPLLWCVPKPCQQNAPHIITKLPDPLTEGVKHSGLYNYLTPQEYGEG